MSLIDSKGKIFGIINIIDLLIILLIVVVAGRFVVRSQMTPPHSIETKNIEITVLASNVRAATSDVINTGDIVRETGTNLVLGEVTAVEVKPADTFVQTADGRIEVYPHPVLKDVFLTILSTGTAGENAVVVGSSEIRIGTQLRMQTNIYGITTTVMRIKVL